MACLNTLGGEPIKSLQEVISLVQEAFKKTDGKFHFINMAETTLRFSLLDAQEHEHFVRCTIRDPTMELNWRLENSNNPKLENALTNLPPTPEMDVIDRIHAVLSFLSSQLDAPSRAALEPRNRQSSSVPSAPSSSTSSDRQRSDIPTNSSSPVNMDIDSSQLENTPPDASLQEMAHWEELSTEMLTRQENVDGANKRLIQDLKDIHQSEKFKRGVYSLEVKRDSLYEWRIKLKVVNKDSPLYQDLMALKEREGIDFIELEMIFMETYPFDAPFIKEVHPVMTREDVVLTGDVITMETLSGDNWLSTPSMQHAIIGILAFLEENARIKLGGNQERESLVRPQESHLSPKPTTRSSERRPTSGSDHAASSEEQNLNEDNEERMNEEDVDVGMGVLPPNANPNEGVALEIRMNEDEEDVDVGMGVLPPIANLNEDVALEMRENEEDAEMEVVLPIANQNGGAALEMEVGGRAPINEQPEESPIRSRERGIGLRTEEQRPKRLFYEAEPWPKSPSPRKIPKKSPVTASKEVNETPTSSSASSTPPDSPEENPTPDQNQPDENQPDENQPDENQPLQERPGLVQKLIDAVSEMKTSITNAVNGVTVAVGEVKTAVGEVKTAVGEVKTAVGDLGTKLDKYHEEVRGLGKKLDKYHQQVAKGGENTSADTDLEENDKTEERVG